MKTAIKLVLIYFGIQLLSVFAVVVPTIIYSVVRGEAIETANDYTVALTLFFGIAGMSLYLWKSGYISMDRRTWSPVSMVYLAFAALACLSAIFILEYLHTLMPWLPNFMESTFNILQSGWLGILCIVVLGPVLEELLFRGAITSALLKKYSPAKAIIFSALIFGIFHINPAQIITATLIGLLLAWVYYKTASLIPCILIHILNNSASVYLTLKYPGVEYMQELFTGSTYFMVLIAALVLFAGSVLWMKRTTVPFPWRERVDETDSVDQVDHAG